MTVLNRKMGCLMLVLCSAIANAAPSINLSKKIGPPTSEIAVWGHGFHPHSLVDIYFDTKDEALVLTNNEGEFQHAMIHAAREAKPGEHWVTALERNSDNGDQEPFVVNTNWRQFLYDDTHTGLNPYENVLSRANASNLVPKWAYAEGGGGSSLAVVDGVLYSGNAAFDAMTGRPLWNFQQQGAIYTAPAVVNNLVYFGTDDGYVYALRTKDGKRAWSYVAPDPVRSSPTVTDGTVYFGAGDGTFFALNASTGVPIWQFTTGSNYPIESAPSVANGKVYFGSDDGNLYALNARTGRLLWKYSTFFGEYVMSGPAIANGVVYFGSYDFSLYALNADTGSLLWSFKTGQEVIGSPVVADGIVYLGGWDQYLYAFDAGSGVVRWKVYIGPTQDSPAVGNGVVYAASQGDMYAVNSATGDILWTYGTNGNNNGFSPILANGVVFLNSYPTLYAFGLPADDVSEGVTTKPPDLRTLQPDLALQLTHFEEINGR